ncbi:PaaI family thioesterase [Nocardia sp. CA-135398]|uniref:PaaI family thioesterase n=1 Tax=Nocardia sp. CA-135398 TaxID=3239977 RepID=UPI003D975E21
MENDALGRIGKLLGITIEQANGDTVVLALPIRPDLWQPDDIVQGGIYAILTEAAASLGAQLWWGDRGPESGCRVAKRRSLWFSRRRLGATARRRSIRRPTLWCFVCSRTKVSNYISA